MELGCSKIIAEFMDLILGSDLWQRNLQINKCTNYLILCYKCSNGIVRNILFEGCQGSDPSSCESNQ